MKKLSDIYRQYASDIYRFALGLSGDPAWADDITAETFVRAMVSAKPIKLETVRGYLFTIARNLYLEEIRKTRRLVYLDERLSDVYNAPEDVQETRDALRTVLKGLQQLAEVDRAALLMHVYLELPYTAVAEALNISVSAAKVKVHRARVKLARLTMEQK